MLTCVQVTHILNLFHWTLKLNPKSIHIIGYSTSTFKRKTTKLFLAGTIKKTVITTL